MENIFTMYPMSQNLHLLAGEVYEGVLNIVNPEDAKNDFYYKVDVTPYSVVGDEYDADLATKSTRSQIVDWIKLDEPEGIIHPNEIKEVHYRIETPADAPAGGQYATLAVRSNNKLAETGGVQIQNVYAMASVIYASVEGNTKHEGEVLSNTIPGFVTNGQTTLSAVLTNSGNVHELAEVVVQVKNSLTGELVFPESDTVNVFSEVVMPDTTRYLSRTVNNMPALGVFEVTQNISYLGEKSDNTVTVVVCPIWFMVLMILTVGTLIGTIAAMVQRRKKTKKVL